VCVCVRAWRKELGYRVVCEQVSHHPPVSAFHAESQHFMLHGSIYPKLKFWAKSIEVTPKGVVTLHLFRYFTLSLRLVTSNVLGTSGFKLYQKCQNLNYDLKISLVSVRIILHLNLILIFWIILGFPWDDYPIFSLGLPQQRDCLPCLFNEWDLASSLLLEKVEVP